MTTVWIYESGDTLKTFASEDEAKAWFRLHDPDGVAFAAELGPQRPAGSADLHRVPRATEEPPKLRLVPKHEKPAR